MNNNEKGILENQRNDEELNTQETLDVTQQLVKEFIDTKQRMLNDDRKLNAIGKALMNQKEMLSDIMSSQNDRGNDFSNSLGDIANRQEELVSGVSEITESMISLEDAQSEQNELVQNLNNFQERHDDLVNQSNEQSHESIERLESLSEQITNLLTKVGEVDIENRVVDIADRTSEINELIATHSQRQELAREDASNQMLELLAEVTSFRQDLSQEGLIDKLAKVQSLSDSNNKMIDDLNEKFDIFVEVYEISESESIDGLEDLFSDSTEVFVEDIDESDKLLFEDSDEEEQYDTMDNAETVHVDVAEITSTPYDETEEYIADIEDDLPEESYIDITSEQEFINESTELDELEELEEPEPESPEPEEDETTETEANNSDDFGNDNETTETNNNSDDFGNDDDIPEYKRIEKKEDSFIIQEETDKKGFFSKLFGGR